MMSRIAPIILLGVIQTSGAITRTRLTKLMFLLSQETRIPQFCAFYDFLPYKYGPYSFILDKDLRDLSEQGIINGERLKISKNREEEISNQYAAIVPAIHDEIAQLIAKYHSLSDSQLIEQIYEQYPGHALLSEIKRDKIPRPIAPVAIHTIGYEGLSIDAFLNSLIHQGIQRVLDVRKNPISRRYGFSKKTFLRFCNNVGIDYIHLPHLGIPAEDRKNLSNFDSYQRLFTHYEQVILPQQKEAISNAAELMKTKPSTLLCYEKDYQYCHRGRLALHLAQMINLPVQHLKAIDERKEKKLMFIPIFNSTIA